MNQPASQPAACKMWYGKTWLERNAGPLGRAWGGGGAAPRRGKEKVTQAQTDTFGSRFLRRLGPT